MSQDKLYFSTVKLLSQHLAKLEPLYSKTACLGVNERRIIALLEAMKVFKEVKEDKETLADIKELQDFFGIYGIGNWIRFELTDLGLRVGEKYVEESEAVVTEADINVRE